MTPIRSTVKAGLPVATLMGPVIARVIGPGEGRRPRRRMPRWRYATRRLSTVRLSHSAKVRVCVRFLQEQLANGPFALKQ